MPEEEKNRFDAPMELARFGAGQWERRRSYEWKVTLGLWALIAAAIAIKDRIEAPSWALLLIGAIVWIGYVFFWLYHLWLSNRKDMAIAQFYVARAQQMLGNAPLVIGDEDDKPRKFSRGWSMRFQALTTLVLILAFIFVRVTPDA